MLPSNLLSLRARSYLVLTKIGSVCAPFDSFDDKINVITNGFADYLIVPAFPKILLFSFYAGSQIYVHDKKVREI